MEIWDEMWTLWGEKSKKEKWWKFLDLHCVRWRNKSKKLKKCVSKMIWITRIETEKNDEKIENKMCAKQNGPHMARKMNLQIVGAPLYSAALFG